MYIEGGMADADGAETDVEGLYAFCICHLRLSLGGREDTFELPLSINKANKKHPQIRIAMVYLS